jgi:hypothetical protein
MVALFIYSNLFMMSSPNTQGQEAASGIVPYNPTKHPTKRASTRLSTKKQQRMPIGVLTCLQAKTMVEKLTGSSKGLIAICCACGIYETEKFYNCRLRSVSNNNPFNHGIIPIRFRLPKARTPVHLIHPWCHHSLRLQHSLIHQMTHPSPWFPQLLSQCPLHSTI